MKGISRNQKIVEILESLKETEKSYPPELMQARRQLFARYVISLDFEKPKDERPDSENATLIHRLPWVSYKDNFDLVTVTNVGNSAYLNRTEVKSVR